MKKFISLDQFSNQTCPPPSGGCDDDSSNSGDIDVPAIDYGLLGQVSGWIRPDNGVFPAITFVNNTSVLVPAGKGYIADPINGLRKIAWDAKTLTLGNVTSDWITTIGVDRDGFITQLKGNIDSSWARSYVILGTITHMLGVIDSIRMVPSVWGAIPYAAYDLVMMDRDTVVQGGQLHPSNFGRLSLDILSRQLFMFGINMNEPSEQNRLSQPLQVQIDLFPITGSSQCSVGVTELQPTKYNPTGSSLVQDIPGTDDVATNVRIYQFGDQYMMLYGQTVYASLSDAVLAVYSEKFSYPNKMPLARLLATISLRKGATDLSNPGDATITIPSTGSGGGNGGSGEVDYSGEATHYFFMGDGSETDFFMAGAGITDPSWYDVYQEKTAAARDYIGQEPEEQYVIHSDPSDTSGVWLRFIIPPALGHRGFAVLRGVSKPYIGPAPITSLRMPVFTRDVDTLLDVSYEYGLIRATSGITVSIPELPEYRPIGDFLDTGSYASLVQRSETTCSFDGATDAVTLVIPVGMLAQTRGPGATISITCEDADTNSWIVSGDLKQAP